MDAAELKDLFVSVKRLTLGQKAELLAALGAGEDDTQARSPLESRLNQTRACPHCDGTCVVRNGSASGLQRYKCQTCRRIFNALSTTPLARLRMKAEWLQARGAASRIECERGCGEVRCR